MKRIFFLLGVLMPFMVFSQKSKIEFETTSHNFGTISEGGGKVVFDFIFKNTGTAPLILTNVRAGCGCTTPEWSREPVVPGGTGKIKVSFDPRKRPGSFVKSVTVNSNAETPVVSLTLRGNVSRKPLSPYENYKYTLGPLKFLTATVNLGVVRHTQQVEKRLEVVNTSKEPVTLQLTNPSPALKVTMTPATLGKGQKGTVLLQYDAGKRNDWGFVIDRIPVQANGKKGELVVTAHIQEDFSAYEGNFEKAPVAVLSENGVTLDGLEKNSTHNHEFYIQNSGKSDLIIHKLKTSDENVSVNVAKTVIRPGKKAKVSVSFKTTGGSKVVKVVQFIVNDPKAPQLTYKLVANIK